MKALSKSTLVLISIAVLASGSLAVKNYQQQHQRQLLSTPNQDVQTLGMKADGKDALKELAKAGHPLAARLLAEKSKEPAEAAKWYEKAAEAGDEKARFKLAMAYLKGDGVLESKSKARLLFSTAGQQGRYRLGMMLLKGEGGPKQESQGIALVQAAAQSQDPAAIYTLGNWYRYGNYLKQDLNTAVSYYKKAANLQYVPALQELALAFEMGDLGLDINPVQARSLSEMAGHISNCRQEHSNEIKMFE